MFFEACAPAHADALNDLSSIPPVSSASHTLGLVAFDAGATATPPTNAAAATIEKSFIDFFKVIPFGSSK